MADFFISYARADRALAEALSSRLIAEGRTVWWDNEATAGRSFREEIANELDAAATVVVIWTPQSVKSSWVISEAQRAHAKGTLVPLRTRELHAGDIPQPFDILHTPIVEANGTTSQVATTKKQRNSASVAIWLIWVVALLIAAFVDLTALESFRIAKAQSTVHDLTGSSVAELLVNDARAMLGVKRSLVYGYAIRGTQTDSEGREAERKITAQIMSEIGERRNVLIGWIALASGCLLAMFYLWAQAKKKESVRPILRELNIVTKAAAIVGVMAACVATGVDYRSYLRSQVEHVESQSILACGSRLDATLLATRKNIYGNVDLGTLGCAPRRYWASLAELEWVKDRPFPQTLYQPWFSLDSFLSIVAVFAAFASAVFMIFWGLYRVARRVLG